MRQGADELRGRRHGRRPVLRARQDGRLLATAVVPGGSYHQANEDAAATVSTFILDRFEVTVGRFRRFVNLGLGTQAHPPASGTGAAPHIAGSGWDPAWNALLPPATPDLINDLTCDSDPENYNYTWTNEVQNNEVLPVNCISWSRRSRSAPGTAGDCRRTQSGTTPRPEGASSASTPGRPPPRARRSAPPTLSTTARDTAARPSTPTAASSSAISPTSARGLEVTHGDGRWGHSDLAGSMYEWTLDWFTPNFRVPCDNCAVLDGGSLDAGADAEVGRVQRSGGYYDDPVNLYTYDDYYFDPSTLYDDDGIRCARDP